MDEQTAFERLTLSIFKKWSSTALKVHSQVWDNFLATESPLKNKLKFLFFIYKTFYFPLKALLGIIKFLSWIFDHVDEFSIYDVTTWLTNNCNTDIDKYVKK